MGGFSSEDYREGGRSGRSDDDDVKIKFSKVGEK
jgi:hypothetical protein